MKLNGISIIIGALLLLSGCQLKEDAASMYKVTHPLQAEISIPQDLVKGGSAVTTVTLTQDGQPVTDPDFVHIEWTNRDGTSSGMNAMSHHKEGSWRSEKSLETEGLYFVKVHASNEGSTISPMTQVVVGELTSEDIQYLQDQAPADMTTHEGHH